jgi:hypothetical protein
MVSVMSRQQVQSRLDEAVQTLPDDYVTELMDFVSFLTFRVGQKVKSTPEPEEAVRPQTKELDINELIMSGMGVKEMMAAIHASRDESPEAVAARRKSGWGCMKGKVWMADDFDAPLDDFKEYME